MKRDLRDFTTLLWATQFIVQGLQIPDPNSTESNTTCSSLPCVLRSSICIAGVSSLQCGVGLQCCMECNNTCQATDSWFGSHRDNFCVGIGGSCQHETNYCAGSYEAGMCGGPAPRKCCTPKGTFSVPLPHFVVQTILLVVIILTNSLVIMVTILDKEHHTIPNIGITSLAVADLLLAVTWFVIQLLVFKHSTTITNIDKNLRHVQDLAFVFEMSVILHILLITLDRYTAILHPLAHYKVFKSDTFSTWKVVAICVSVWAAAAFLAYTRRFSREWTYCYMSVVMNMMRTILPLTVTAMLNIIIFLTIRNKTPPRVTMAAMDDPNSDPSRKQKTFLKNKKAFKTISLILISIMLSYVPLSLVTMVSVCGAMPGLYERMSNYIVLLKFMNSITNPTIYMLTTRQFKQSVRTYLGQDTLNLQPTDINTNPDRREARGRKISLTGSTSC